MKEYKVPVQSLIDHIKTATDVDPWAKEMAEDLLKKQVPIQPKKVLQAGVAREYYRCFCPECETHVGNIISGKRAAIVSYFCQNCGQAVKWE